MATTLNKYFGQCQECKFAEFTGPDEMTCQKSVVPDNNPVCIQFSKIDSEEPSNLILSGKINEIINSSKERAIQNIKDQISEVILIESKRNDEEREIDYRINTKDFVDVFSDTDLFFNHKLRTIDPNTLVPYRREIIRDGIEMLLLKEPNGEKAYIELDHKKLVLCEQCKVKENPIDILLISHDDFNDTISSIPATKVIDSKYVNDIHSYIDQNNGQTEVRLKNTLKKDGKNIPILDLITLSSPNLDVKIGRLAPGTNFYITKSRGDKKPRQIKTEDGREGILLSPPETYKVILPPLQQFVNFLIAFLTIGIAIAIIATVVSETGYLVVIGIAVIILGYLVAIFVGAPVYLILNSIIKRL